MLLVKKKTGQVHFRIFVAYYLDLLTSYKYLWTMDCLSKSLRLWLLSLAVLYSSLSVRAQVCSDTIDLTIMMDSTSEIGSTNFQRIKDFVQGFVEASILQLSFATVGLIFIFILQF